jgi:hypothetical protein
MPSSAGYLITAVAAAVALFFGLWWMFVSGGDEAPWIPAGLAASVVLLVALSAREVVMRRAWTKYLLEEGNRRHSSRESASHKSDQKRTHTGSPLSALLRTIEKQSGEADMPGSSPELHLEVFHLCRDYVSGADEALQSSNLLAEKRVAIRAGQERVKNLQRHHLLIWARESSRALTNEAQQRARTSDKIETANRAMHCLDSALKVYPEEPELNQSKLAIREFIASVKVAHWVELAERSAFKGHYRRAIERYKDALFYLNRETVNEEVRLAGASGIANEIQLLQAKLRSSGKGRGDNDATDDEGSS